MGEKLKTHCCAYAREPRELKGAQSIGACEWQYPKIDVMLPDMARTRVLPQLHFLIPYRAINDTRCTAFYLLSKCRQYWALCSAN